MTPNSKPMYLLYHQTLKYFFIMSIYQNTSLESLSALRCVKNIKNTRIIEAHHVNNKKDNFPNEKQIRTKIIEYKSIQQIKN